LKWAVERLLRQAAPRLEQSTAAEIARAAVKHPAVAHNFHRATTALSREELNVLLNDLAVSGSHRLSRRARRRLRGWLATPLVRDGLEEWFAVVMRRTTERYAGITHLLTAAIATASAGWLQVDSLRIYNELASHQPLRLMATRAAGPEHWLGVLMTAVFLSLGAPFWYNLLRRAASLRPLVAQAAEEISPPAAPTVQQLPFSAQNSRSSRTVKVSPRTVM
jgi:hypothetical protein